MAECFKCGRPLFTKEFLQEFCPLCGAPVEEETEEEQIFLGYNPEKICWIFPPTEGTKRIPPAGLISSYPLGLGIYYKYNERR